MTRSVEILAGDWRLLRDVYPETDERTLVRLALERGAEIVDGSVEERVPQGLPPEERGARLRALVARRAAGVAVLHFTLVATRARAARAEELERETYERHLELDKDVVPPLKLEAKALRAEIRRLEEEALRRRIDTSTIEPHVNWPNTLAVDTYERPQYETNESRRRTAVEFFRRVGE